MIQTLKNAWKIEDLRKKILFTLLIILLYRVGNAVPVPYVNVDALQEYFKAYESTMLGLYNMMSGGAFSQATIFALSIQPYINASIIIQLLCIAIPALERLSKEGGEEGRKKIASITRYATVGIGLLMGFAYYMLMRNYNLINDSIATIMVSVDGAGSASTAPYYDGVKGSGAAVYATGGARNTITSVPEPSVALMGLLGIGMLIKRRRA